MIEEPTSVNSPSPLPQERRTAPRKPLRRRIALTLADFSVVNGQTVDISSGGLHVAVPQLLKVPQECMFELTVMQDGKVKTLSGRGRMLSCTCAGMNFNVGLQFLSMEDAGKALVDSVLNGTAL